MVCEKDEARVAVESDRERFHLDEHGQPKVEDIEREATLRRARWRVIRIPYRKWLRNRAVEWRKSSVRLKRKDASGPIFPRSALMSVDERGSTPKPNDNHVTRHQEAIIQALREGIADEERLLYRVRDLLGVRSLTGRLRDSLLEDARALSRQGLVREEEQEYFLTPEGRNATLNVVYREMSRPLRRYRHRVAAAGRPCALGHAPV